MHADLILLHPPSIYKFRELPIFYGPISVAIPSSSIFENYPIGFLTMSAMCSATAVLVTVHPQMLDVMSMCQFLIMTSDLLRVVANAGGNMGYDWMRYLITRYEPGDGPQNQVTAFLRSILGDSVLIHPMLKSTAISDAGLTNQTIFEVERKQFTKTTYDRALESVNAVNAEIEALIKGTWGRAA